MSSSDDACAVESASRPNPLKRKISGPNKAGFERVFSQGICCRGKLLRIYSHTGSGFVGFAIAKKLGSHPLRNKLRRRLREALRTISHLADPSRDYVVAAGPDAAKANQVELKADFEKTMQIVNSRQVGGGS